MRGGVVTAPQHCIVMGVAASGKTTIATRLAARLQYAFADADDFHPAANVAKMARGIPLTDADREPWLRTLAAWIAAQHKAGRSSVLACSALKRRYRDLLRAPAPREVFFVHLAAPREALLERLRHRQGHFMSAELLDSQLAALEPLQYDEPGIMLEATGSPEAIIERVLASLAAVTSA
jgi:gluconokinase